MSSGTNKLVLSESTMRGATQAALASALMDANTVAKSKDRKVSRKK